MGEKKRRQAAAAALEGQIATARRLHAAGQLRRAEAIYRDILRVDARRGDAWLGLGLLARDGGTRGAAEPLFARAAALSPDDVEARVHYASALQDREDFDAACIHWRAACALRGTDASLWETLGIAEQAAGNIDAAVAAYRQAIQLDPTPARRLKLATAISPIPASRAAIAAERERMRCVLDELLAEPSLPSDDPDPLAARMWTNFYLAYHGENDRELQMRTAAVYRRVCPSLGYVAPHCRKPSARAGRIRVGLVSQFFRNHSIGRTSRGLFERISREQFEVTAIFLAPFADDALAQAIRRDADRVLDVPRDLRLAREQIAALELDVLFYPDIGMEPFGYFLSFARLAPVQCVSFGHPDTTGVPTVDWFVSNDLYEPPDAAAHYSEKLFMLHNLGSLSCYRRPQLAATARTRPAFGLPTDRPVYLCPQNLFKMHPDMDDLIAGILRGDPRGVVVMVEGRVQNWTNLLRRRWQTTMADVQSRILFVPRMRGEDFLGLIAAADVMLDTIHFNGMNTSLEAFAVGTPVVTLPAALQRGRHTLAMYRKMGLDDLVATDANAYVESAVRLATDATWRREVSARIQANNGVLFDDDRVVREFERFFHAALAEATGARP